MNNINFKRVVSSGEGVGCGQGGVPTSLKDMSDVLFHKVGRGGRRGDLLLFINLEVGKRFL